MWSITDTALAQGGGDIAIAIFFDAAHQLGAVELVRVHTFERLGTRGNIPALLIKISIGPSPSGTADTIACTCFIRVTSAWTKIARRPQARTSSATRWDRRVCASGSKFQRHRAADPLLCPRDQNHFASELHVQIP
jgi:hypothetical protein